MDALSHMCVLNYDSSLKSVAGLFELLSALCILKGFLVATWKSLWVLEEWYCCLTSCPSFSCKEWRVMAVATSCLFSGQGRGLALPTRWLARARPRPSSESHCAARSRASAMRCIMERTRSGWRRAEPTPWWRHIASRLATWCAIKLAWTEHQGWCKRKTATLTWAVSSLVCANSEVQTGTSAGQELARQLRTWFVQKQFQQRCIFLQNFIFLHKP